MMKIRSNAQLMPWSNMRWVCDAIIIFSFQNCCDDVHLTIRVLGNGFLLLFHMPLNIHCFSGFFHYHVRIIFHVSCIYLSFPKCSIVDQRRKKTINETKKCKIWTWDKSCKTLNFVAKVEKNLWPIRFPTSHNLLVTKFF